MMDLGVGTTTQNGVGRAERVGYQTSPHAPNTPENNILRTVIYRGTKVSGFNVNGRELICLPQAFELFLKHLVGGLHTVYTKLKRLEITPVVCNVEQVRLLRTAHAIALGVNRCKLISAQEFDVLYQDCTSSSARPGRPPKRSFFPPGDLPELSPSKQLRRSLGEPGVFPFDGLKHMTASPGTGAPLLSSPQSTYHPLPLPGMPFVSPYQINLMHQAAVQMALASQLQQSSVNKGKVSAIPTSLPHSHNVKLPHTMDVHHHQAPELTCQPTRSPPALVKTSQSSDFTDTSLFQDLVISRIETQSSVAAKQDGSEGKAQRVQSPASCYSEDLNVDDEIDPEEKKGYSQQYNNRVSESSHTPPALGPTEPAPPHTIPTPPPSLPREPEQLESNIQHHRRASSEEVERKSTSPVTRKSNTPVTEDERENLDDILIAIKLDIQSFMDSVIHHQEEIVADIEVLRSKLKMQTCSRELIETFMKEQQHTKMLYQSKVEKDSLQRQHIDSLLQLTKSDLTSQWWNKGYTPQ